MTERRIKIDLASREQTHDNLDIDHIGLLWTVNNITDAFTKITTNKHLEHLRKTGILAMNVLQWIITD